MPRRARNAAGASHSVSVPVSDGAGQGQHCDRHQHAPAADAERGQRDDFAVGGHAAQAEQNADQHRHRDGEDQYAGKDVQEKFCDLRAGA